MSMRPQQHRLQMLGVAVHRTGHKRRIRSQSQGGGIERMIDAAHGRTLGNLMFLGCR